MKKVLIAYPAMMLGGSTTSLLSILYNLDSRKYKIDLLLAFNTGDWLEDIPKNVTLLEPAYKYQDKKSRYIHRLLSPRFMLVKCISKIMEKKDGNIVRAGQYLEMKDVDFYRDIDKEYDVAVSFLEGQTCKYVAKHVVARKKIAWIHVDYKQSRLVAKYDVPSLSKFQKIVHVSSQCMDSFNAMFPELSERCIVIENILSQARLRHLAMNKSQPFEVNKNCINIVTTCRLTYYQKGLDRAIGALQELKQEIPDLKKKMQWYIIGNGPDYESIKKLISDLELGDIIILLGEQKNPYQFYEKMDCFFLPSRYEGKPMAVTEALMLSLPIIVTKYSSAHEQIADGVEGKVFDNSDEGTKEALMYIINSEEELKKMRDYISGKDYSNQEEMKKIEALLDEE